MSNDAEAKSQCKLGYLVGYMKSALTNMRDLILQEHYSKLFPKIEDALKLLNDEFDLSELFEEEDKKEESIV